MIDTILMLRCLVAVLLFVAPQVQGHPTSDIPNKALVPRHHRPVVKEDFQSFNTDKWSCEYSCPIINSGKARFRLHSDTPPDEEGSWSKVRYTPKRFTSGRFTVSFSMTARPEQEVWWGVALWDNGPAEDGSEFNEINFGYVTDQSFTNTQLRFESARRGKFKSVRVDTEVDLYDESYHNATLEYTDRYVAFYLDAELLKTITDKSVIPTDPMDLVLGPRLVTGSKPLTEGFTQSINWVEIVG
ncbi:putative glycoside hydrolase family protein [Paramyrothecium foliicola]|nr:putative glycoside hydrolase family protein [Paramyrothecium foliicola]